MKSGARFHVGGYGALSCECDDKGGVILGYEQPLTGKVSFVTDFLSGENFWGYLTPGISVVLPHSGQLSKRDSDCRSKSADEANHPSKW